MALGRDVVDLQNIIGYSFKDIRFLEAAMTHSSYTNEMRAKGMKAESNERLEFLGDAVLELVISEYLYENFSKYREGALTKMRQRLVCEKTLSKIATSVGIGEFINLGNGEETSDCRKRPKILADALEALIGAVYLDSKASDELFVRAFILKLFDGELSEGTITNCDYKTMLQQLSEQDGAAILEYKIISEDGPEHKKIFTVEALINNNVVGKGSACTKKDAEMEAARIALRLFGVQV